MDDGVTEIKELVFNEKNRGGEEDGHEEKERVDHAKESEEKGQYYSSGGVISNLISVLVSKDSDQEEEEENGVMEERKQEEEKEGHGLINHLISNLVSPLSPKVIKEDHNYVSTSEEEKGGGIFNNLISGILHQSEGGKDEGHEQVKTEEASDQSSGGGGLIDNIISHLPTPLADDAAPGTDEASILIHSIVHD